MRELEFRYIFLLKKSYRPFLVQKSFQMKEVLESHKITHARVCVVCMSVCRSKYVSRLSAIASNLEMNQYNEIVNFLNYMKYL